MVSLRKINKYICIILNTSPTPLIWYCPVHTSTKAMHALHSCLLSLKNWLGSSDVSFVVEGGLTYKRKLCLQLGFSHCSIAGQRGDYVKK